MQLLTRCFAIGLKPVKVQLKSGLPPLRSCFQLFKGFKAFTDRARNKSLWLDGLLKYTPRNMERPSSKGKWIEGMDNLRVWKKAREVERLSTHMKHQCKCWLPSVLDFFAQRLEVIGVEWLFKLF